MQVLEISLIDHESTKVLMNFEYVNKIDPFQEY